MATYNYSKSPVSVSSLAQEINDSSISSGVLTDIQWDDPNLDITFDVALSAPDQTTLNGLVTAHAGTDPSDPTSFDGTGVADGDIIQYNSTGTVYNVVPRYINRNQTVFVGKHGDDANSGLNPENPKLTFGSAMTAASALTPSASNRISVLCLDGGTYTESFTVPSFVDVAAWSATIEGTVTLSDDCEVYIREVYKATTGNAVEKTTGTSAAYLSADIIRADGAANGVVNGATTSIIIVHTRQLFVENGTALLDNSTGSGHIHMDIEDLYLTGTGTGIDRASNTGAIQGRVSHILNQGAGAGTAIDITTGNVNVNIGTIDTTVAWNVAGAGSLHMFVNEIISGTKVQTAGTATVNVTEAQLPRWIEVDNADSPFLSDRFGNYSINTTAGAVTLQLPTPASDGDNIRFSDVAKTFATNNFTLDGNGSTIDGLASQTLDIDGAAGLVIYSTALGEWSLKRIQEEVGFSPTNVIYVTKNGNDTTGTGSFSNPFLTVAKGVSVANAQATSAQPATVKVLDGVYDEVNPINLTNEYANVQGSQEFAVDIRPTVPASDLFIVTSGTATLGPSISRCTLRGTAAFKTAGSSLVRTEGDGRFVFDKVNLFTAGIGIEAGQGTISAGQETVWDFATASDCDVAVDVSQTGKMAMQVVFMRGNDVGLHARNDTTVEIGNFSVQNAEDFAENGTGIILENNATMIAISGTIRNCVTGLEGNDSSLADLGSVYFIRNTNDFNQVDATAEILVTSGSLEKDSLLIADGDLIALNYLETDSRDFIIGSANSTGTPGLEFRVRQADGRVFIGDQATNGNAPTNTVGGSRTVNLVDTNGNLRIWRWQATPGLHPAFEWLKGVNTFAADDEGDAPITTITGGANGVITIDLSGADYNDPLDPGFPGADRTTLDTRVFYPGAEIRVNGTPSDDGDYVVQSSTYNSGPQTIDVTMTTAMTGGGTGTAVFGGGAGRPDGVSTYIGDPSGAIAAGVGDVHWDMLLRETDSFAVRRRTGGAGKEHFRFFRDRSEFQHGPAYSGSDNSLAMVVEGVAGTGGGSTSVNYLQVRNAAPGSGPEIEALGDPDTDIDIELIPKGTGTVVVPSGYEANVVDDSLITKAYIDNELDTGATSKVMNSWTLLSGTLYYNDFVHNLDTTEVTTYLYDTATSQEVRPEYTEIIDSNTLRVVVEGNTENLTCNVVSGRGPAGPQGPPGAGATQLNELSDVNTSTPTNRNVLVADGVDFESRALVEADISDLGTYLENVVEDTTPQLGGNLDLNQNSLVFAPPTTDLTGSGIIVSGTVDTNATGFGAALYMAADGNFDEADADAAATMPCRALALAAGTGTQNLLLQGFIRNDAWTWTPGGDLYISTTTGALTQTAPTGNGDQVQKVGFAWTADIVYFSPGDYTVIEVSD